MPKKTLTQKLEDANNLATRLGVELQAKREEIGVLQSNQASLVRQYTTFLKDFDKISLEKEQDGGTIAFLQARCIQLERVPEWIRVLFGAK